MPVIYLDVLVSLNWLVDGLLLSATARLLRQPYRRWRLITAALLGGVCACVILLPELPFFAQLGVRAVTASLMVLTAFSWNGAGALLKRVVTLFAVSAVFAGVASAVWYFAAPPGFTVWNGVVYYEVSPLWLTGLSLCSYGVIWMIDRWLSVRRTGSMRYEVTVGFDGGDTTLAALLDTGHHLSETFSGMPVILVQRAAVERFLPPLTADCLQNPWQDTATAIRDRLRLIPCETVAGRSLLPAFCPKRVTLTDERGNTRDVSGCFLALTDRLGRGDYQALIGPDLAATE